MTGYITHPVVSSYTLQMIIGLMESQGKLKVFKKFQIKSPKSTWTRILKLFK